MSELSGSETSGQPTDSGSTGADNSTQNSTQNVDTKGIETKTWRDSLPDDLKNNATLANFDNVENLAKSYVHAQSVIGKKGVIKPGEKASDEEWGNFYKELGVEIVFSNKIGGKIRKINYT